MSIFEDIIIKKRITRSSIWVRFKSNPEESWPLMDPADADLSKVGDIIGMKVLHDL